MDAYGPPPPPDSSFTTTTDLQTEVAPAFHTIATDPIGRIEVPAVSSEPVTDSTADAEAHSDITSATGSEPLYQTTPTSSVVESPKVVASSWSMSPLPEGEGGIVTSSTSMDPITQGSALTASPQ
jgi:hypothetical protein